VKATFQLLEIGNKELRHHLLLNDQFHLPTDGQKVATGENDGKFDGLRKHNQGLRYVKSKETNLSIAAPSFSQWEKFQRRKKIAFEIHVSPPRMVPKILKKKHSRPQFFSIPESQRQWRTVGHDNSTYYQKAETQQALWPNGMQTCEITEVQITQKAQTISTPDDEQLT